MSDDEDNLFASSDEEYQREEQNVVNYDEDDNQNDDYQQEVDVDTVEDAEVAVGDEQQPPKQQRVEEEEEDVEALFDDGDDDNDEPRAQADADMLEDDQEKDHSGEERSEDDEPAKPKKVMAPAIEIAAPLVPLPPSSKTYLMKTSNIIDFEPRPFDPDTFQIEEEMYEDEQGIKRIRLRDQNVVRWRWKKGADGSMERESNARFIKWSDGSWQLQLGDEVLDVAQMDMSRDHTYLYVLHGGTLQGQAHLTSKLQCRPSSLDSRSHKRLRDMVGKRHSKVYRVGQHIAFTDPEKDKANKEKVAQEKIKARETQARKQERVAAQYARPTYQSRMTAEDLEQGDDDDILGYDTQETAAHLRRTYDDEGEGARKLVAAQHGSSQHKRRRAVQDDDDDESEDADYDGGDDAEEEDEGARKKSKPGYGYHSQEREKPREKEKPKDKSKPKAKRGVVLSDDDDDE